jgi:hypothetical protein
LKLNALVLAVLATSTAMATSKPVQAPLNDGCEKAIRTAVAALDAGYITAEPAESTISKEDQDGVKLSSVVIASSCIGPSDCSEKEPDAFTWVVTVGKKAEGLNGKVKVSYHRGNCIIESIALKQ